MSTEPFSCGVEAALTVIAGKWKLPVIHFLMSETRRYGELKRCVGKVTDKVLIQQLKELEADGVVERTDHGEIPPRVDYALTPFGRSLAACLCPLTTWGQENSARLAAILKRRQRA